jgi:N,N-dimethylformamidase
VSARGRLRSPVAGIGLEGYAEEISVPAGGTARFMLSGPDVQASVELVRLVHGDPSPLGPGPKAEPLELDAPSEVALREQPVDWGSFVEVADAPPLSPAGSFTLALWFQPTRIDREWKTLAAKAGPGDFAYGLYCCGHRTLAGAVSFDGREVVWVTALDYVQPREWQLVALAYSAESGRLSLLQSAPLRSRHWSAEPDGAAVLETSKPVAGGPLHRSRAPLLLGASASPDPDDPLHCAHFDGKLARPLLVGAALSGQEVEALAVTGKTRAPVLAAWDLSREVETARVVDVSPYGCHGVAVNAPARAVTGPGWGGEPASLYADRPGDYDAVHVHEDDLDDARWESSVEARIPAGARSGIHCLRVRAGADSLDLPFVVRPSEPAAPICYVAPTLTWQAYSSNAFPWSYTEDGLVDRGVCIYMPHSDGSMTYYVTRRKPTRSGNPSAGYANWGGHTVAAALYLVDWLEEKDFAYEVVSDEDVHRGGRAALDPYRCVILGPHPEYWTAPMLEALRGYVDNGGRVLYLGGNGLYWVTSIAADRPFLMEVRKSGEGDYDERWIVPEPGQYQHSTTLEVGGLWSRRGYPPRALVGVEHSANVFTHAQGRWGFRRLPASERPRFAWVFEGVDDEVIGDFGLNLGSAAGYEMDAALDWEWAPDVERVVLARAAHAAFLSPKRLPHPAAADIALTLHAGGGAVFAAGSITWTGSLSWNGYANNVSRVTENALRRFSGTPRGEPIAAKEGGRRDLDPRGV